LSFFTAFSVLFPPQEGNMPNTTIHTFFDEYSSTFTYVLHQGQGSDCAIIDPVLDYNPNSGRTSTQSAEKVAAYVREHGLRLQWIIETHAHADHLSASVYLREQLGGQTVIGQSITTVQRTFADIFNLSDLATDGSQFDKLLADGDSITLGSLRIEALHVPGHTPADSAWRVHMPEGQADVVFVGDTIFSPQEGTARCDFPGGSASQLYQSLHKLLALPADTRLFLCHSYVDGVAANPSAFCEYTVAQQKAGNIHVKDGISEQEFVAMRTKRDATLDMPRLILPSVQVNIRAGHLPPAESNGTQYLKIPLNLL
jgi:glyoxylase-like metal-dependent hydrolase (beta-lactamase superfamily II)